MHYAELPALAAGQFAQVGMHLRTVYRDGFTCTVYEATTRDAGFDLARVYQALGID